jgi:hypothetical protein
MAHSAGARSVLDARKKPGGFLANLLGQPLQPLRCRLLLCADSGDERREGTAELDVVDLHGRRRELA